MNQKQKLKKYSLYEKFKCQNLKNTRIKTFITVIIYYHYMFVRKMYITFLSFHFQSWKLLYFVIIHFLSKVKKVNYLPHL